MQRSNRVAGLTRDKIQVLLLLGLFLLPIVAAIWYRPSATMNSGELVVPARPLAEATLRTLAGEPFPTGRLGSKWSLVYFGTATCGQPCVDNLYKMRQVRLAQGKELSRVQYVYVVMDGPLDEATIQGTMSQHPDALVLTGDQDAIDAWVRQFTIEAGSPRDGLDRIYVVDPLGNLMMSYPADADPSGMRKDLARLLKVSRIG